MACLPVQGDNPQASTSGLSCVHVDKHGIMGESSKFPKS